MDLKKYISEIEENLKGLFFAHFKNINGKNIRPGEEPNIYIKDFENKKIDKISLFSTIDGCLKKIYGDLSNKTLFIYEPEPNQDIRIITNDEIIEKSLSSIAKLTDEVWAISPIKIHLIGRIKINKIIGYESFTYDNNKIGRLPIWAWEWIKESSSEADPKILYYGSNIQDLKIINPEITGLKHLTNYSKTKIIYASDNKSFAAAFIVGKTPFSIYSADGVHWTVELNKKYLDVLQKPCSIYTIPSDNFVRLKVITPEWISLKEAPVLKEEKYISGFLCFQSNNLILKIK